MEKRCIKGMHRLKPVSSENISVFKGLRLRDTVESAIIHGKFYFTTKHVCCVHMLASYLTAVLISRLLKPHAHFVNRMRTTGAFSGRNCWTGIPFFGTFLGALSTGPIHTYSSGDHSTTLDYVIGNVALAEMLQSCEILDDNP